MEPELKLTTHWQHDPRLMRLFAALKEGDGTPRLVGGAVRDALLGIPQDDYDVAINQPPEMVIESLEKAGINFVPTGLQHGTVTAIVKGHPYQITSLRTDLRTDGRHAEVAFTDDWRADAMRRDFTINALYGDLDGHIYDPCGGVEDLNQHCVRFIGAPLERIQEDYLRILRFFRFSAYYGKGELHPASLMACIRLAPHIQQLAKERITQEFLKLLKAPYVVSVLKAMIESGILQVFLEEPFDLAGFEKMVNFASPDSLPRLAAAGVRPEVVFGALRLSNQDIKRYKMMFLPEIVNASNIIRLLYLYGPQTVSDWANLQGARGEEFDPEWCEVIQDYTRPRFPLNGQDVLKKGISGPKTGELLRMVEGWWIDNAFQPHRKECLAKLDHLVENEGS